ncbi:hypothetical protein A3A11_02310 [Candidatus Nomurabacteria bacterium RIFCSPLOWO2_01_FULL_43_15]|nr:MAG: hypothetical protein A3A11_02310 [Candidatus Nomurabacteria bacterium RIFCSPLOWO2_01_FULL_43_15]
MKQEIKTCQNCKKDFMIEPEDFNFYEKIKVPPPTWCSECRAMRRMLWRNERSLYHHTCALSGKKILSMFSPETNLTVYDQKVWWSDKWDPTTYGQNYNFSRPFFEQFKELFSRVPLANLGNTNIVNSEYGNNNYNCKNCYLIYASLDSENVFYAQGISRTRDSFDLYTLMKSEQCYEDVLCGGLFNTHFSYDSDDCIDSSFLTSCLNLQNCLGCVNLRHKTHCILNRQYTKEGYNKKIKEYDFGSYKFLQSFKDEYKKFLLKQPRRFASILKSVSVTGDNVIHSKNSKMIFDAYGDVEDSKYLTHTLTIKNSYDGYGIGYNAELLYEGVDFGLDAARNFFGIFNHRGLDTQYTYMCYSSKNLFGCVGLRSKQYCILNKQYTKGEYEKLVPQIIAQMNDMPYVDKKGRVYKYGEFFPTEFSPFYYNETIAQEYYPLTEKRASDFGFKWKNKDKRDYQIDISTENLPDHIKNVEESIVGKVIECIHKGGCEEQCIEAFKITSDELQFYKRNNIALPRLCPNCRHFQRLKKRNPLKLWHRGCMCGKQNHFHGKEKCKVKFETSYASGRPEIVYCEKCYQAEVY